MSAVPAGAGRFGRAGASPKCLQAHPLQGYPPPPAPRRRPRARV